MVKFEIAGRPIGGARCFVIAEAGVNHNGDLARALEMIDVAAEAGADAIKFQTFRAALVAAAAAPMAEYQKVTGAKSQLDMLRELELDRDAHVALAAHAASRGIAFLSTPFDDPSADMLAELGMAAFKIASGEVTNTPFLARIAAFGRPMIVSTGMADLAEVAQAVSCLQANGAPPFALLHCVSLYPAPAAAANLRAMETLRAKFGVPIGYSDHTLGMHIALAAVGLGAEILEKHFTLSRTLPGPDHAASLEPDELRQMIRELREIESALGDGIKAPNPLEAEMIRVARRSLVAAREIGKGQTLTATDFVALRPGGGVEPARLSGLVGRAAPEALPTGSPVPRSWLA